MVDLQGSQMPWVQGVLVKPTAAVGLCPLMAFPGVHRNTFGWGSKPFKNSLVHYLWVFISLVISSVHFSSKIADLKGASSLRSLQILVSWLPTVPTPFTGAGCSHHCAITPQWHQDPLEKPPRCRPDFTLELSRWRWACGRVGGTSSWECSWPENVWHFVLVQMFSY